MVRRLADQGLLAYERYRGVRLTDAGRRAALRTIRRHRVIEAYLVRALGYPWAPAIFIGASAVIVANEIWRNGPTAAAGLAVIAAGVPAYFLVRRGARRA